MKNVILFLEKHRGVLIDMAKIITHLEREYKSLCGDVDIISLIEHYKNSDVLVGNRVDITEKPMAVSHVEKKSDVKPDDKKEMFNMGVQEHPRVDRKRHVLAHRTRLFEGVLDFYVKEKISYIKGLMDSGHAPSYAMHIVSLDVAKLYGLSYAHTSLVTCFTRTFSREVLERYRRDGYCATYDELRQIRKTKEAYMDEWGGKTFVDKYTPYILKRFKDAVLGRNTDDACDIIVTELRDLGQPFYRKIVKAIVEENYNSYEIDHYRKTI